MPANTTTCKYGWVNALLGEFHRTFSFPGKGRSGFSQGELGILAVVVNFTTCRSKVGERGPRTEKFPLGLEQI